MEQLARPQRPLRQRTKLYFQDSSQLKTQQKFMNCSMRSTVAVIILILILVLVILIAHAIRLSHNLDRLLVAQRQHPTGCKGRHRRTLILLILCILLCVAQRHRRYQ